MKEHIQTYIHLRNRGQIEEEVINRVTLTLRLKNGATVRMPISRKLRKCVNR